MKIFQEPETGEGQHPPNFASIFDIYRFAKPVRWNNYVISQWFIGKILVAG
jgi:hypothetical protein